MKFIVFLALFSMICSGCEQNALGELLDDADKQSKVSAVVKDGYIEVSWASISQATGYNISRSTSLDGSYTQPSTITRDIDDISTTCKDTPAAGGTYYYKVQAYSRTPSSSTAATGSSSAIPYTTVNGKISDPSNPVNW